MQECKPQGGSSDRISDMLNTEQEDSDRPAYEVAGYNELFVHPGVKNNPKYGAKVWGLCRGAVKNEKNNGIHIFQRLSVVTIQKWKVFHAVNDPNILRYTIVHLYQENVLSSCKRVRQTGIACFLKCSHWTVTFALMAYGYETNFYPNHSVSATICRSASDLFTFMQSKVFQMLRISTEMVTVCK